MGYSVPQDIQMNISHALTHYNPRKSNTYHQSKIKLEFVYSAFNDVLYQAKVDNFIHVCRKIFAIIACKLLTIIMITMNAVELVTTI